MSDANFQRAGPPTPRMPFGTSQGIAPPLEGGPPPGDDIDLPDDRGLDTDSDTREPTGPDRDNAQRLIRWADPTKTLNGIILLGVIVGLALAWWYGSHFETG